MSNFFSKYLGKIALMVAAVLWSGCGDSDKKADESAESQKIQEQRKIAIVDSVKTIKSKYLPVRDRSITSESISGVTALYGVRRIDPWFEPRIEPGFGDLAALLYSSRSDVVIKPNGSAQVPKETDITVVDGSQDVVPAILKVVRKRTPGLSHIYRKYLKKKPGFNGTVVLKLKVDEQGAVENIVLDSSTTGYEEFDNDVTLAVSGWTFEKKKVCGTFKIPFTFYEKD